MKRTIFSTLFYVSIAASAAGCYAEAYAVAPGPVVAPSPPPAEVIYVEAACPAGYVWVGDYYHWNGYSWVLVQGGCTYRPGYIWIAPSYIHVSGGVTYVAGYWKPVSHHHVQGSPPPQPKKYHAVPPAPSYKAPHSHTVHPKVKAIPK
jgi:hypothetical protein